MKEFLGKIGRFILDFAETVSVSLAIFVVVYLFIGQHSQVKGMSMYPNLQDQDSLLVSRISYEIGEPKRGDVAVFRATDGSENEFVKRVVGIPGDVIKIHDGLVYINGIVEADVFLQEGSQTNPGKFLREDVDLEIPEGFYFVLGDNRPSSSDSREWGLVPKSNIIGKVVFRFWPPDSLGTLDQNSH